jgi:hypothetical protein
MANYDQLLTLCVFTIIASSLVFVLAKKLHETFNQDLKIQYTTQTQTNQNSMHFFGDNVCSPKCCFREGSSYSCSSGCICMSDNQQRALAFRGNNASTRSPDLL